ncbi:hypothetical protein [Roseobacter sp. HKCCA0434]|uniref:hypothetical protein n=1 Tax=Roseobacter sp. HKCCA0434 TaxID=3079297 RepID=UPI002905B5C1|nr:hypothetical protein [Roseobacter sp. HKCCA0434]
MTAPRAIGLLILGWLILTVTVLVLEATGRTTLASDALAFAERHRLLPLVLVGLACLIAMPFMPRVTLSLSVILLFGPDAAPLVWLAMIAGVTLAFLIGRHVPYRLTSRAFAAIGIADRAAAVAPGSGLDEAARLRLLLGDHRWTRALVRWRYVAAALLPVLPGNMLLGGAGGLAMLTGLTRAFHPIPYALAVAIPLAPLPLAIWAFGLDIIPGAR